MLSSNATVSGNSRDFSRGPLPYRLRNRPRPSSLRPQNLGAAEAGAGAAFGSAPFATMNLMVSLSPT